jgi:N-acetylmuramoyl-L-alanine amidase
MVQNQLSNKAQLFDRGVKQAGFLVLWKTTMPAILIETGFISNAEEEKFLNSDKGQVIIASAIFRAFRDYKNQIENRSVYANDLPEIDTSLASDDHSIADTNLSEKQDDTVIINDSKTPGNIEFYVQISSSQKPIPVNSSFFKGLSNVEEIYSGNTYKYIVGKKGNYKEIVEYSKIVKNYFPDAFIVAISDGKIIPLKDALKEIKD